MFAQIFGKMSQPQITGFVLKTTVRKHVNSERQTEKLDQTRVMCM